MQKLVFGAYLPDFTSQKNENWKKCATFGAQSSGANFLWKFTYLFYANAKEI